MSMSLMERYARWVVRHRTAVVISVFAITAVLTVGVTRLHIEVNPDRQVPQGHPYIDALNDVYRIFGDKNLVIVGLFPNDGDAFTPHFLAKLAEVTRRIQNVPGANPALVQSLATPQVKDIHGTADGFAVQPVMAGPPVDQAEADAIRQRAMSNDTYVGTLVAEDGSAAAVHASFELNAATPDYRTLHHAVVATLDESLDGTFSYRLSGPVVFLAQVSAYSDRMAWLFPIALLVIGLVHYDAFRTFQGLVLPLLTGLLAVLWSLGVMGVMGVALDPLNVMTPILILAVASGHAVQVLKRFYEEYARCHRVNDAVIACVVGVGPVMLAAGTVATLSFWSLATFGTTFIRTFGVFTGLGILSTLVIEMTLIPSLRSMLPAPSRQEQRKEASGRPLIDRFLGLCATAARTHRRTVGVGALLFLVGCVYFARDVVVDTSFKRSFRATDRVRVDDDVINRHFAGTNTLIVLVEGSEETSLEEPAIIEAIWELERTLEQDPLVGRAVSYVDYVQRMHAAMTVDRDAGEFPDSRELVAQYLFLYSMSGGGDDFDAMLDPAHLAAKVRFLVHEDSTKQGEQLIARARQIIAERFPPGYRVRFTGTLASTAAVTEVMVDGKLRNIAQITAITVVIAAGLLQSVLAGCMVAIPLFFAVMANFGVMGLFGVPLDTATAAISAMAVGIGADYAMYFLFRVREEAAVGDGLDRAVERALFTSGRAVVFVSSAVATGYATFCLSGFGIHVNLGSLVALAMVISATSTLVLLPALVMATQPRFVTGNVVALELARAS